MKRTAKFWFTDFSAGCENNFLDKFNDYWKWPDVATRPIASTSITIDGQPLGSDGNLWRALEADRTLDVTPKVTGVDYYVFNEGPPNKYPVYIQASVGANNYNLETNTPEICVGQKVTFSLGGVPACQSIDGVWWHLPDKYVNQAVNYSATCTNYVKNTDLLTLPSTPCWYINQPGGACSVRQTLHFANGQSVNLAAVGNFTVHRPTISNFQKGAHGFDKTAIGLQGSMTWNVKINSKYNGFIGVTQIINCNNPNSDYYTGGVDVLDGNTEIYGEPDDKGEPKQYISARRFARRTG